jgi:hypothetical protein
MKFKNRTKITTYHWRFIEERDEERMGKDCDGFQPFSFQKVTIKKTDESCLITEPLWQCQASSQNLEKPDDKTKR